MSAALILPVLMATARPAATTRAWPRRPAEGLAFYRKHTEGLLRRFMVLSMEMGRAPSLLGNAVFRGKVSHYRMRSFEDSVIFVFDVEKCLKKLDINSQDLITRIGLQEYTFGETAASTNQSLRSVIRRYNESLDRLTKILLDAKLLNPGDRQKRCQGAEPEENLHTTQM